LSEHCIPAALLQVAPDAYVVGVMDGVLDEPVGDYERVYHDGKLFWATMGCLYNILSGKATFQTPWEIPLEQLDRARLLGFVITDVHGVDVVGDLEMPIQICTYSRGNGFMRYKTKRMVCFSPGLRVQLPPGELPGVGVDGVYACADDDALRALIESLLNGIDLRTTTNDIQARVNWSSDTTSIVDGVACIPGSGSAGARVLAELRAVHTGLVPGVCVCVFKLVHVAWTRLYI